MCCFIFLCKPCFIAVVPVEFDCAGCFRSLVYSFSFPTASSSVRRWWLDVEVKDHLLYVGVLDAENGNVGVRDKTYDRRVGNI